MILFEEKERSDSGPKTYIESDFEYLDRSGRSEADQVRQFLNHWVSQLEDEDAKDIVGRIISNDSQNYASAIFELVLFAIMRQLGCELVVHPDVGNGKGKRPDFLVRAPQGEEFYLEAVLASEYDDVELSARNRTNVVLESIDGMESPNFFLGISATGNPDTPPRGRVLKGELTRWLEGLDPDDVANTVKEQGYDAVPKLSWSHDDWVITFEAIPIKPEKRGLTERVIATLSGGVKCINIWKPIKKAVVSKGNRYGKLDKPLLIAINVDALSLDRIDEMQALFGQEEFIFSSTNLSAEPDMRRIPNGAWIGQKGPQYTRVSGAWLFDNLNPWNIVSRKNNVYFNPHAAITLPDLLKQLNHACVDGEKMVWAEAAKLSEILGLSESWPE